MFGRYASLTYGPQLTNIEMLDKMNIQSNIYNVFFFFFFNSVLRPFQAFSLISRRINR